MPVDRRDREDQVGEPHRRQRQFDGEARCNRSEADTGDRCGSARHRAGEAEFTTNPLGHRFDASVAVAFDRASSFLCSDPARLDGAVDGVQQLRRDRVGDDGGLAAGVLPGGSSPRHHR